MLIKQESLYHKGSEPESERIPKEPCASKGRVRRGENSGHIAV